MIKIEQIKEHKSTESLFSKGGTLDSKFYMIDNDKIACDKFNQHFKNSVKWYLEIDNKILYLVYKDYIIKVSFEIKRGDFIYQIRKTKLNIMSIEDLTKLFTDSMFDTYITKIAYNLLRLNNITVEV